MTKTLRMRPSADARRAFAEKLLDRMAELDMTQADLARRTGYSKDAVSTWARKRSLPTDEALQKISKVLQVDPDDLLEHRFERPKVAEVDLRMLPGGRARLVIDTELSASTALKIAQLVNEDPDRS